MLIAIPRKPARMTRTRRLREGAQIKCLRALWASCFLILFSSLSAGAETDRAFTFAALGDTAYSPASYDKYRRLIDTINSIDPAFSIHVGDTQGHQPCDSESLERAAGFFDRYDHPVFYTPGDNEWADCMPKRRATPLFAKAPSPAKVKLSALAAIRRTFFDKPQSLGSNPLPLTRQSDVSEHTPIPENSYWKHNNVLFATLHVVGSRDGRKSRLAELIKESVARGKANLAWLKTLEKVIDKKQPNALVIALHAELFDKGEAGENVRAFAGKGVRDGIDGPYFPIVKGIAELAQSYPKPILLVHGDFHHYTVDKPFDTGKHGGNITRLQVFGEPQLKAVKVTVNPDAPKPFSIEPLESKNKTEAADSR